MSYGGTFERERSPTRRKPTLTNARIDCPSQGDIHNRGGVGNCEYVQRCFLDHRRDTNCSVTRPIVAAAGNLKLPDIKAIAERVDCQPGRTKAALVSSLENWLSVIKASAEQSAFTLTGRGELSVRTNMAHGLAANSRNSAAVTIWIPSKLPKGSKCRRSPVTI